MKQVILITAASIAMIGVAAAEPRDVSGFDSVRASGRFDVEIVVGEAYAVDVTGSDANHIRTRLEGDALAIEPANRPWIGPEPRYDATVRVTTPRLTGVSAARGAELSATGVTANAFDISATMGGEARAAGSCGALDASASMGGVVEARALQCENADASASMGGSVEIFASQSLDASASMGGSVEVSGSPARRDVSTSMGGSVSLR
jgi:hypothetical protein